jgi:hypothetical protein
MSEKSKLAGSGVQRPKVPSYKGPEGHKDGDAPPIPIKRMLAWGDWPYRTPAVPEGKYIIKQRWKENELSSSSGQGLDDPSTNLSELQNDVKKTGESGETAGGLKRVRGEGESTRDPMETARRLRDLEDRVAMLEWMVEEIKRKDAWRYSTNDIINWS